MTKKDKLIASIYYNPKQVRFADACKIAKILGFKYKAGQGSHTTFGKIGKPKLLNFQNRKGFIPPYQAKQLIEIIQKHWTS